MISLGLAESVAKSHLMRGAWIEMDKEAKKYIDETGRTSCEVRGLKYPKAFCKVFLWPSHLMLECQHLVGQFL